MLRKCPALPRVRIYILKTYIYWKSIYIENVQREREDGCIGFILKGNHPSSQEGCLSFPTFIMIYSTAEKWTDHNEIYISRQLWKVWHCSLNVRRIRCSRTGTTPPENQWWDLEKEKCSILFPPFPQVDSFVYENCSHNVDTFSEFCTGKYEEVDDNAED